MLLDRDAHTDTWAVSVLNATAVKTRRALVLVAMLLASCGRTSVHRPAPFRANEVPGPARGTIADAAMTEAFADSIFADFSWPGAPGAAVLVAQEGRILLNKAFGLADLGTGSLGAPATTRTNFRLASVTKQFTAAAALLLVKDGKLRLEESLTDIFRDFPAYGRRITVRHLLTHTSGLLDYEDFIPDTQTIQVHDADVLARMKQLDHTYFDPGTRWKYSNTGYAMLAEIIAERSGITFAEFLRTRIFLPLGMLTTVAFQPGTSSVTSRAFGFSLKDGRWSSTDQSSTSAVLGDGGIYSSVDELYRWDQALYTNELLSKETLKEAFAPFVLDGGSRTNYGFGWFVDTYRGLPRLYHTGETIGFRNAIARFPGQRGVIIILTNRSNADPAQLAARIADRVFFASGDSKWHAQPVASASSCRSVSALSASIAWIGCSSGKVFHTIDGGATWQVDSVPGAAELDFRGIHAFDANTAVVASAGPAEQGQARIYRTTDAGAHWTIQWSDSTRGIFLDGLAFWDARHGIAFSDPVDGRFAILITDDGGTTWSRVSPRHIPPALPSEAAFAASNTALTVQGSSNAWIATGGGAEARVFRTTDRGRTWSASSTGLPGGASRGLFGIAFADANNGVAVGGDYAIARGVTDFAIRTRDGGVTWQRAGVVRPDGTTQGIAFVPGSSPAVFVAAGAYGTAVSRDFGETWVHGDTLTSWGVSFAGTESAGWVAGPRGRVTKFIGNIQ